MNTRSLALHEHRLLKRLIAANQKHIGVLVNLENLEAKEVDEFGSLKFKRLTTADTRQRKLPAEATLTDKDGVDAHALLFTCGGELDELQFYKDDGSPIQTVSRSEEWIVE